MIEPVADRLSHERALRRIEDLWDAKPGSREERELDALATLVDAYERRAFPIRELGPLEAIGLRCEQLGWTRRELEPLIGSRARVSEVLSGRRALTLPMIRRIYRELGIPAEVLISETPQHRSSRQPGNSRVSRANTRSTERPRPRARPAAKRRAHSPR
jgi:HTH-type transcriptional regulator / antitoxin HigA